MNNSIAVRPYSRQDRASIRRISCDTADKGEPIDKIFHDREIVADLLTRYYTDYEPHSTWVAESGGNVVGYLNGCLNTRRYYKIMLFRVLPRTLVKAFLRGVFYKKESWIFSMALIKVWRRGGFDRKIPLYKYPAHLHINIDSDFRGKNIGRILMERFVELAGKKGLNGIHLTVKENNANGRAFFEKMGFAKLDRYLIPQMDHNSYIIIYGKEIARVG